MVSKKEKLYLIRVHFIEIYTTMCGLIFLQQPNFFGWTGRRVLKGHGSSDTQRTHDVSFWLVDVNTVGNFWKSRVVELRWRIYLIEASCCFIFVLSFVILLRERHAQVGFCASILINLGPRKTFDVSYQIFRLLLQYDLGRRKYQYLWEIHLHSW